MSYFSALKRARSTCMLEMQNEMKENNKNLMQRIQEIKCKNVNQIYINGFYLGTLEKK